jgi:hypothetical protein
MAKETTMKGKRRGANRVLLSSCFRPWGVKDEYNTQLLNYEAFGNNFSNRDGIWTPRGICNEIANHFIAVNIETPTTVLDNPSLEEFEAECKKAYSHIGISAMTTTIKKAKKMIEVAQAANPEATVILGGYVTVTPGVEDLKPDLMCDAEDGVVFMRRLLGEPMNFKYKNPKAVPMVNNPTMFNGAIPHPLYNYYHVPTTLGCPRGCHFCASSAYWKNKQTSFFKTGKELYEALIDSSDGLEERRFTFFEDNFSIHKKRNMELMEFAEKEVDKPFFFFSFNEIASTSAYDPEDLVSMGCDVMFLGVESQIETRYFNKKKHGGLSESEIRGLFRRLHEAGIQTVAASIVTGTDEHTPADYWRDLNFVMSLDATWHQFATALPAPRTPFWNQCLTEDRIAIDWERPDFDLLEWTGIASDYKLIATHKTLPNYLILAQLLNAYNCEGSLGPDLFRSYSVKLNGAKRYKNARRRILRSKAEIHKRDLYNGLPLMLLAEKKQLGLKKPVRQWIEQLRKEVERFCGKPDGEMMDRYHELYPIALREYRRSKGYFHPLGNPPVETYLRRTVYNETEDPRVECKFDSEEMGRYWKKFNPPALSRQSGRTSPVSSSATRQSTAIS